MTQPWSTYPGPQPAISWTDASGADHAIAFEPAAGLLVETETWGEDAEVSDHPVEVGANVTDHVRVSLRTYELKVFSSNEPIGGAPRATVPINVATPSWVPGSGIINVPHWNNLLELRALGGALVGLLGGASGQLGAQADLAFIEVTDALLQPFATTLPKKTNAGLVPKTPVGLPTATVEMQTTPTDFVAATHAQLTLLKNNAQVFFVGGTKDYCTSMVIEKLSIMRDVDTGTGESFTVQFKELRIVSTQVVTAPIPNLSAGGGKPSVGHGAQTPHDAPPNAQASVLKFLESLYANGET